MVRAIIFIILSIVVLTGGFIAYRYFNAGSLSFETITAQRGKLIREISATGRVVPPEKIDLQFKNSGKLTILNVKVGDHVEGGKILAEQDASFFRTKISQMHAGINVANAQLANYQAVLKAQQAKLDELKQGTRPEEVKVYEVKVQNAKTALDDSETALINKLQDTYTKSDDAIRNKVDQLFDNPRSASPTIKIQGFYKKTEIEWERVLIESTLTKWQISLGSLNKESNLDFYIKDSNANLKQVRIFLDKVSLGVNALVASATLTQTTIDAYRSDISTSRTNINTAIDNLSTVEKDFKTSQSSLTLAESEIALKKAGTVTEQITAQQAQVEQSKTNIVLQESQIRQAEALLQEIETQVQELIMTSPVEAIVTVVNSKVGEIAESQKILISLIPEGNLEIKVNISEINIVDVKINQEVKITLDAFGKNIEFTGKIKKIDPAETIIGGAVYYKATVLLDKGDDRIKPGMTANVLIITIQKENVLLIPAIATKEKDGREYVKILDEKQIKQKEIITGLKGKGGVVEVISGINEGEEIIVGEKR